MQQKLLQFTATQIAAGALGTATFECPYSSTVHPLISNHLGPSIVRMRKMFIYAK